MLVVLFVSCVGCWRFNRERLNCSYIDLRAVCAIGHTCDHLPGQESALSNRFSSTAVCYCPWPGYKLEVTESHQKTKA